MNRSSLRVLIVCGVLVALLFAVASVQASPGSLERAKADLDHSHAPGQILVKFNADVDEHGRSQVHSEQDAVEEGEIQELDVRVVRVPEARMAEALAAYRDNPDVAYAEPNYLVQGEFVPNDPYYTSQYGPQTTQADKAWDITMGDPQVTVAVVDSGADFAHPDLQGKLLAGYDYVNNDADPSDDQGHGTHVAGIIAAATNNGKGIAGIAGNTRLLVIKVLNSANTGSYSIIAQGIIYAADHGANIINLSLGGTAFSQTLLDAVEYAWGKGALLIAAAGNTGSNTVLYPAACEHVIAVAATTQTDAFWSGSSYGNAVSVCAPGSSIYSTYWDAANGSGYATLSGTSMAAPHVCGVAALLLAQDKTRSNAELRSIIESTADDLGTAGRDIYYGYGRVNAYRALTGGQVLPTATATAAATATATPTPTQTATPTPLPSPGGYVQRVNCGGLSYTDSQGLIWAADQKWNGAWGYTYTSAKAGSYTSVAVNGTVDDLLYQKYRDNPVEYRFTLPNGTYQVRLRFAEFRVTTATGRIMRITIEGMVVDDALSIWALAGKATALDRVYQIGVVDGQMNILLAKNGGSNNPIVSAIELELTGPPPTLTPTPTLTRTPTPTLTPTYYLQRANAGGAAFTDSQGVSWAADQAWNGMWGYTGGTAKSFTTAVNGTVDDALYQKVRLTPGEYRFAMRNGRFEVTLHFAEFEVSNATDRVMRITIEGVVVENALSIWALAGKATALQRTYQVDVRDGQMNILFAQNGGRKPPVISAIEIELIGSLPDATGS